MKYTPWTEVDEKDLASLWPSASKEDILDRFPNRTWGALKNRRAMVFPKAKRITRLTHDPLSPTKTCSKCRRILNKDQFSLNGYCRLCQKKRHLMSRYGITLEKRQEMYVVQKGLCGGCKRPFDIDNLNVDHRHDDTKKVRGLLCLGCNVSLGNVDDSIDSLEGQIDYLIRDLGGPERATAQDYMALIFELQKTVAALTAQIRQLSEPSNVISFKAHLSRGLP